MKKISIITVNYNDKKGLESTILSVIEQTSSDFEFIVIDGGSTDGSKDIIEKHSKSINHWVSEADRGIYHAMNKGIRIANGEYFLFLNSGDRLTENTILTDVIAKMDQGLDIYYGDIIYEDPKKPLKTVTFPKKLDFSFFYRQNISHQASFIKRTLFEKVGLYNENHKIVSDWEFFMIAIFLHRASYQHLELVISNYDGAGISSDVTNHTEMYKERDQTLSKYFAGFKDDYRLFNTFTDKKFKQLLYLKKNHKLSWTLIKGMLKAVWVFQSEKKKNYENLL